MLNYVRNILLIVILVIFGSESIASNYWDINGNLAQVLNCGQNAGRFHEWDEENRMRFVLGEKYAGYYGYDGNGERVYKLTGISSIDRVNSGGTRAQAFFDNAVLYPNPYIVVTPKGYTKHYYAGTERLATVIGEGGFGEMLSPMESLTERDKDNIIKPFFSGYTYYDPFLYNGVLSRPVHTVEIEDNVHPKIDSDGKEKKYY